MASPKLLHLHCCREYTLVAYQKLHFGRAPNIPSSARFDHSSISGHHCHFIWTPNCTIQLVDTRYLESNDSHACMDYRFRSGGVQHGVCFREFGVHHLRNLRLAAVRPHVRSVVALASVARDLKVCKEEAGSVCITVRNGRSVVGLCSRRGNLEALNVVDNRLLSSCMV